LPVASVEIEPKHRRIRIKVFGFNLINFDPALCGLLQ